MLCFAYDESSFSYFSAALRRRQSRKLLKIAATLGHTFIGDEFGLAQCSMFHVHFLVRLSQSRATGALSCLYQSLLLVCAAGCMHAREDMIVWRMSLAMGKIVLETGSEHAYVVRRFIIFFLSCICISFGVYV